MPTTPGARFALAARECAVESWQVARSLSSWGLPGQARVPTGVGTGQGSARIWDADATGPAHQTADTAPGSACSLAAATDTSAFAGPAWRSLLRGVIREVSADGLSDHARDVSFEDDMGALQRPALVRHAFATGGSGGIDAAYLIDQAGRAAGFSSLPIPSGPSGGTMLSVPMDGSLGAEVGTSSRTACTWDTRYGRIVATDIPSTTLTCAWTSAVTSQPLRFITLGTGPGPDTGQVALRALVSGTPTTIVTLRRTVTGGWQAQRAGESTWRDLPGGGAGVIVEIELTWVSSTTLTVRGRVGDGSGGAGAWGTTWTLTGTSLAATAWHSAVVSGTLAGVQLWAGVTPARVWQHPNTAIAASGVLMQGIVVPPKTKSWDLAQSVARATAGSLWIDGAGMLNFAPLATILAKTPVRTLKALTDMDSRPWSSSRDDFGDRLEATYTPLVDTTVANNSLPVWEASEVVHVLPGRTITIESDVDVAVFGGVGAFSTPAVGSGVPAAGSWWVAASAPKGGTRIMSGISVIGTMLTPQRIRVRITNTGGSIAFMCDAGGNPRIVARANRTLTPGEQQTVDWGATDDEAVVPATIDLGTVVQDESTANTVGSGVWQGLQNPKRVLRGVGLWPVAERQICDVETINDPGSTLHGLKVVITSLANSGSSGLWTQTADLALID